MPYYERFMASPEFWQLQQRKMDKEDEGPDTHWVIQNLPFSDLSGEWLHTDSLLYQTREAFDLQRLAEIRALSFLAVRSELSMIGIFPDGNIGHNRDDHSTGVAMVTERVLTRNKRSPHEIALGTIAGMTHDMATPAGGDALKFMDPANLHEEDHWQEMLQEKSRSFLTEHEVTTEELDAVIHNEGMNGEVLDRVDRIVYTMKDVHALVREHVSILTHERYDDIRRAYHSDPSMGNIYRDIMIDPESDEVYFNDPGRLRNFLTTRALMHKTFYYNPETAGRDRLFSHFVKPFYAPDGSRPLTPQLLRTWGDVRLMNFLADQYAPAIDGLNFYEQFAAWYPEYERFDTQEEADKVKAEINQNPNRIVMDTVTIKGFNPAIDYLVKDDSGNIVPYYEADEEGAEQLKFIVNKTKGVYLYTANISNDTPFDRLIAGMFRNDSSIDASTALQHEQQEAH